MCLPGFTMLRVGYEGAKYKHSHVLAMMHQTQYIHYVVPSVLEVPYHG